MVYILSKKKENNRFSQNSKLPFLLMFDSYLYKLFLKSHECHLTHFETDFTKIKLQVTQSEKSVTPDLFEHVLAVFLFFLRRIIH
jgi:hypothetical protein